MGCNSSHAISGSGQRTAAYYKTSATALTHARKLARPYAKTLAGLERNGFECPNRLCQRKRMTLDSVTITSLTSSLGILASIFWLGKRYEATVKFDWKATIHCSGPFADEVGDFMDDFTDAVKARAKEVWTIADGDLGNFGTTLTGGLLGDGCVAWALWVHQWLIDSEEWFSKLKIKQMHIGRWPFYHQVILVCFEDGTEIVLDPWRDKDDPFWDKKVYEKKYGKLKEGFSQ